MPHMPVLRVVPLEKLRRHEQVDPLRVERLTGRIEADGVQVNPMVCSEAPSGELVLLDGATRAEALIRLGLEHAVVQLVEPSSITLETWHHVLRQCPHAELLPRIEAREELILTGDEGRARLHLAEGGTYSVVGDRVSPNATLSALVDVYVGRWTVSRVTDPADDSVAWRFPDWSVVVEFPRLTVEDVMKAAVGEDLLPAGVTRFLVDERALRLNVDLSLLSAPESREEKQQALDDLLETRARAGRIRRYEETIFILDE